MLRLDTPKNRVLAFLCFRERTLRFAFLFGLFNFYALGIFALQLRLTLSSLLEPRVESTA
jgi:hypothetical protein